MCGELAINGNYEWQLERTFASIEIGRKLVFITLGPIRQLNVRI